MGGSDYFQLAGQVIDGRYRVDEVVGEGGFGVVYKGFHLAFAHAIAIKCLKTPPHFTEEGQAAFLAKFREEAQLLSRLSQHPAIVRVYDFNSVKTPLGIAAPYMALEWLDGQPLDAWLAARAGRPMPEVEAATLLRPAMDGLAFAHAHGVAHRDVKPANIFVVGLPGRMTKVLDFGIAKAMQEGETATQLKTRTSSGFAAFSPSYGAPEQFRPNKFGPTGPWTDVHALGLILTEMVTGRPALEGEDQGDFFAASTEEVRPTPRARGGGVSDVFEAVCVRALARMAADRYRDAGELLRALDGATTKAVVVAAAASQGRPLNRPSVRSPDVAGTTLAATRFAPPATFAHGLHPTPAPRSSTTAPLIESRVGLPAPTAVHESPARPLRLSTLIGATLAGLVLTIGFVMFAFGHAIAERHEDGGQSPAAPDSAPGAADDKASVPLLIVNKLTSGPIVVDGKANEPVWSSAAWTGRFVDVGTGAANTTLPLNGTAKVMWDDHNLYILVQVQQADFYTGFTDAKSQPGDFTGTGQPKLWSKDTIEMMVEPDAQGTNTNYYELQIGPQNKIFKSQFDTQQQPNDPVRSIFGHEDWDPKLTSAVSIQKGTNGKTTGYTVEAAIPWGAFTKAANLPPQPGEVWRVNFYAMHQNSGVAWSPILGQGNFHKASRFAKIVWASPR